MAKFKTVGDAQRAGFALIAHVCRIRENVDPSLERVKVRLNDLQSTDSPSLPDTNPLLAPYLNDRESMASLIAVLAAAAADLVGTVATIEGITGEKYCQRLIENILWIESR